MPTADPADFSPCTIAAAPTRADATMGIYDRDYNRGERYGENAPMGFRMEGPLTLTTKLVLVMFGVYAVQLLTRPADFLTTRDPGWFSSLFGLHADFFRRPWLVFELLTYGFLHSVFDFKHILFNMLGLWMFGRSVEERYSRREYLAFFLTAIVFAGLCWVISEWVMGRGRVPVGLLSGASGGVTAIVILFAFHFPYRTVLFMFFIPMPMWVLAVIIVGMDAMGAVQHSGNVAFTTHLGGAAFAAAYYKFGFRLTTWLPERISLPRLRSGPKLRVHDPTDDVSADETEVDDILRKIQEKGQDSLTRRERQVLEQASREYQKRKR
jgi:membrane associated rhomboid family serine protease